MIKKSDKVYMVLATRTGVIVLSKFPGLITADFPEAEENMDLVDTAYGQMWKYESKHLENKGDTEWFI